MTERNLLITGGTGFIGQDLCPALIRKGYQLTVLSRKTESEVRALCGRVTAISALTDIPADQTFSGVINLAGEGIADKRWTEARKKALRDSRIALSRELVTVLLSRETLPQVVISGSAVGYYGAQGSEPVNENTTPHDEFAHQLCRDWEQAVSPLASKGVRLCLSRTGLVVGANGGFLERMALPFKLGLGGRIGSGHQYMPWVHRDDVVGAIIWMLENTQTSGPYNVVSPAPVTNREFTSTLGKVLRRPVLFPVPEVILRLALGEMSDLLLTGQRAVPEKLLAEGYQFVWPELEPALKQALR